MALQAILDSETRGALDLLLGKDLRLLSPLAGSALWFA